MGSLLLIKCGNSVCNAVCSIPTGKRGPTGSFNINDKAYLGKDANIMYLGSNLPIHKYHTCLLHSLGSETLFMKIFDHMTLSVTFDLQFKNLNADCPSLRFATLNVHVFYIYTPPPPFSFQTAQWNSMKCDRKQDLNINFLHQVCVFMAIQKNKMAAQASNRLRHFQLLL